MRLGRYLADGTLLGSGSLSVLALRPYLHESVGSTVLVATATGMLRAVTLKTPLELTLGAADHQPATRRLVHVSQARLLRLGDQAAVGTRLAMRLHVDADQSSVVETRQLRLESGQFLDVHAAVTVGQRAADVNDTALELRQHTALQTRAADRLIAARSTVALQHVLLQTHQALQRFLR